MSEKIPISCIGDGFRYEYYEGTNKDKHITSGYGPLTHKLKFQVSVDGIDKEFMINDISCTETYDKIASNAFGNELDQKDRLDSSTTLGSSIATPRVPLAPKTSPMGHIGLLT